MNQKFTLGNQKDIISIEDSSGFERVDMSLNFSKTNYTSATTMSWHKCNEKFNTNFTKHAIGRLQEYAIDLTTINVPLTMLADEILELKNKDKFAIMDKLLDVTLIAEIEIGYDLTIDINIITVVSSTTYRRENNNYSLKNINKFFILGE